MNIPKTTNTAILEKIMQFQKEIGTISKDGKNPHFKSSYATLPNILSEVKPVLTKLGLILQQPIRENKVYTEIIDPVSGQFIESWAVLPEGLNPQQMGSATTYYRRYLLAGLLSLEIEDDDGNASSPSDTRQWLNEGSEEFKKAVKYLQSGNKIEDIEKKYRISAKTREKLLTQAI